LGEGAAWRSSRPERFPVARALLRVALVGVTVVTGWPLPVGAQESPTSFEMVRVQREYEAAFASCEAAILARNVEQEGYEGALARVDAAGRTGDEEAWEAANREFLQISRVLDEFQRRIRERCDASETARKAYLGVLDDRRRGLEDELTGDPTPERRADVLDLLEDLDFRYQEIEEGTTGLETRFVMRPLIEIDERDTPDAVRNKAAYLERRVQQADSVIADYDREIERIDSRIRTQRTRDNFRSGLGRFDDTRTPVGSDPREGEASPGVAADSTALSGRTLERRLEEIRAVRQQLQSYRDQMMEKVDEFRSYLERIT
jgi:hypothetical protein